jgi:hypothetical protein
MATDFKKILMVFGDGRAGILTDAQEKIRAIRQQIRVPRCTLP